jgi:hypothetical protein
MKANRINFYATAADVGELLRLVEIACRVSYTLMQNSVVDDQMTYKCWREIPNLGVATKASSANCDQFLILKEGYAIKVREIIGGRKEHRYLVDQLLNEESVTFNAGGLWNDDVILMGWVASTYGGQVSRELLGYFSSAFRRHFRKVRGVWVGPEADKVWKSGSRLTINAFAAHEFDLVE